MGSACEISGRLVQRFQRYAHGQTDTDRQTDIQVDHNTLHAYWGRVIKFHTSSLPVLNSLVAEVSCAFQQWCRSVRTLRHQIGTDAELSWAALHIQDRSPQLRPIASECACDWLRNATGLECGDRSWISNAPLVPKCLGAEVLGTKVSGIL